MFGDADVFSLSGDELRKWETMAKAMVRCAPDRWQIKNMEEAEMEFCQNVWREPHEIFLAGKVDGLSKKDNGKLYVRDYKTKGSLDLVSNSEKLRRDLQGNIYTLALSQLLGIPVVGFEFMVLKRSLLKQRKASKETLSAYLKRIVKDYEKHPEKHYGEMRIEVSKNDLDEFAMNLHEIIHLIVERLGGGERVWHMNHTQCSGFGVCQYLDICNGARVDESRFDVMGPDHHPELNLNKGEKNAIGKNKE